MLTLAMRILYTLPLGHADLQPLAVVLESLRSSARGARAGAEWSAGNRAQLAYSRSTGGRRNGRQRQKTILSTLWNVRPTPDGDGAVERRRAWINAVEGRDADDYASIVTNDVVWFPPVGEPLHGRAAFRQWIEPFMGTFRYRLSLAPTASNEAGDWAYETGAFRSVLEPIDGGAAREHDGHYFVLWRNDTDGAWRIERYVDLAVASMGDPEV